MCIDFLPSFNSKSHYNVKDITSLALWLSACNPRIRPPPTPPTLPTPTIFLFIARIRNSQVRGYPYPRTLDTAGGHVMLHPPTRIRAWKEHADAWSKVRVSGYLCPRMHQKISLIFVIMYNNSIRKSSWKTKFLNSFKIIINSTRWKYKATKRVHKVKRIELIMMESKSISHIDMIHLEIYFSVDESIFAWRWYRMLLFTLLLH